MSKISKISVTTGVQWVEIKEADIRILCGCPADSVKHLMKRGLIVPIEKAGVTFETGPNCILLSDVMIQNGSFANMAEFPVLQMLYRQGMILPKHPGNTGRKPMLLGSPEQVNAQMDYIYRGNYGLTSKEEIMATGTSEEDAEEMMRMKLHFAFGKIHPSQTLLDSREINKQSVEIQNGVMIRSLGINLFEISYQGESIQINLNLQQGEVYGLPYSLNFHKIPREYFAIIHSGCGDGWDILRPSMSSIIIFQGKIFLIDAGPNLHYLLDSLGIGINEVDGIFHTHSHDDHFAGLTSLMRTDHRIRYYATPLVRAAVTKKTSALLSIPETEFNNYFETMDLQFDLWNNIEGLEVRPSFSPHPVETSILTFRALGEEEYLSYGHFADIAAFKVLDQMRNDDKSKPGLSSDWCDRIKKTYLEPVSLKKIDVGGGMIHGNAEDFHEDQSKKIILAHTNTPLSNRQKEIGSGAPFGTVDVLIPSNQDYAWRYAFDYLRSYYPSVPVHELRVLLSASLVHFNPESILIKGNEKSAFTYLILTGSAEMIDAETGVVASLSAGALLGEMSGLMNTDCMETYRAVSFVRALAIPNKMYLEFVKRNNLYREIEQLQDIRTFLHKTYLFGSGISYPIQNGIAKAMITNPAAEGEVIAPGSDLCVIYRGLFHRIEDDLDEAQMKDGGFFGEGSAVLKTHDNYTVTSLGNGEYFRIPGELLSDIPIVRWKLFEAYQRRRRKTQGVK